MQYKQCKTLRNACNVHNAMMFYFSCEPAVPDMHYNVFGGTLNLTQSIQSCDPVLDLALLALCKILCMQFSCTALLTLHA